MGDLHLSFNLVCLILIHNVSLALSLSLSEGEVQSVSTCFIFTPSKDSEQLHHTVTCFVFTMSQPCFVSLIKKSSVILVIEFGTSHMRSKITVF